MKTPLFLIAFSVWFVLAGTNTAEACTCKGRPQGVKGVQTCGYYWRTESIFVGLAEKVEIDNKLGSMKVTFSVERSIRGTNGETVEIFTSASSASCGYPFKQGERYFVYARKGSDGKLSEGLCGPTTLLGDAQDDLEYTKEIESGKLGTRIFGSIYEDRQPTIKDKRTFEPLADIEITIKKGEEKYKTRTDEKGAYVFKDIPFGSYAVTASFPNGFRELFLRADLTDHYAGVNEKGRCDDEGFRVTRQGSIRGKVVDFPWNKILNPWNLDNAQPMVSLIPLDENNQPLQSVQEKWAYRDKFEYSFDTVPAGNYLLAINPRNCPYPNNGIPTVFFPGVADRSQAKLITVRDGEHLVLQDFRSRPMLRERWFSGVVVNTDQSPAANVTVRLRDGKMNRCSSFFSEVKTDASGRFKIQGFETYDYSIDALTDNKDGKKQRYATPLHPKENEVDIIRLVLDQSF